jgi:parallel beta-helix repeat protein
MNVKLKNIFFALLVFPSALTSGMAIDTFYVSPAGNDSNVGSFTQPWKTIQHAASTVSAGSVVLVRGGTYSEAVTINVSGSANSGYTQFRNYAGETAILDGSSLTVPSSDNGLFFIDSQSYICVQGFELRNYRTSTKNYVPVGIHVLGTSHHIKILGNKIHNIEHNGTSSNGTDAHGIACYGTSGTQSMNNIVIDGNELYSLKLGSSESLVLNGNVDTFQISNNIVHDNNNIGIDMIGFEGTASANDQARNGIVYGNTVYDIDSYGNVAYGTDRSADGIYVDGGKNIVIERNRVYRCNLGIELASEHSGKSTSNIVVRSNFIYRNDWAGIAMGGYDTKRGSTKYCIVVNNTLFQNDVLDWDSGEIYLQYDIDTCRIQNNIVVTTSGNLCVSNDYTANTGNVVDYNLYFNPDGTSNTQWQWKKTTYTGYSSYSSSTGNDAHSLFVYPMFMDTATLNLHLSTSSAAVNAGILVDSVGTMDFDGDVRIAGMHIDIGADEYQASTSVQNEQNVLYSTHMLVCRNYPNPFNPSTVIDYQLPVSGFVTVKVYDVLGREVSTLVNEIKAAGNYTVMWNAGKCASGVYFSVLQSGLERTTHKMLLMK